MTNEPGTPAGASGFDTGTAKQCLAQALAELRQLCIDSDPIARAIFALDQIQTAASLSAELPRVFPAACGELIKIIPHAAIALGPSLERWRPADYVHLRMSALSGVLSECDSPLHFDRRLYISAFLNELRAIALNRAIAQRGDPLVRHILIRRAADTDRTSCIVQ
ncbi:hypothetical protein [Agrobacterium tumefaciens]|uniref:hypothetical protein n=1 Tax=Agrobacterium tumefaciens TaxID=358 RepID=UPI003BA0DD7F